MANPRPNAGNIQPTPVSAQQTVQIVSGLTITSISPVSPNPRNTTVATIDVTFSESIDPSTLTSSDLTLTQNGVNVPLSSLSFTLISGTTYQIGGLATFDATDGLYALTVSAAAINASNETPGTGSLSASWAMDTTPPASTVSVLPAATTSTTFTVAVTGSDPNGPGNSPASGIASFDIFTNTDGGAFTLWTTVTPASPAAQFSGEDGQTYGFYSVATDEAGNIQSTPAAAQQTVQILAPMTVVSVAAVAPNPQETRPSRRRGRHLQLTHQHRQPHIGRSDVDRQRQPGRGLRRVARPRLGLDLPVNRPGRPDDRRRVVHADRQCHRPPGYIRQLRYRLGFRLMADGHHTADQHGQSAPHRHEFDQLLGVGHGQRSHRIERQAPSGIQSFTIYVSEDSGPLHPFATVTPASPSTSFTGQLGHAAASTALPLITPATSSQLPASAQQTVQIVSGLTIHLDHTRLHPTHATRSLSSPRSTLRVQRVHRPEFFSLGLM